MDNSTENEDTGNVQTNNMNHKEAAQDILGRIDIAKQSIITAKASGEGLGKAQNSLHDYSTIFIEVAIDDMRRGCPDSVFVEKLADLLTEITSDRRNVKIAGEILGLTPSSGRVHSNAKAEDDLQVAAECYRRRDEFPNKTALHGEIGEKIYGSGGKEKHYTNNQQNVARACKRWEVLFNSGDIDAINRTLKANDLELIY